MQSDIEDFVCRPKKIKRNFTSKSTIRTFNSQENIFPMKKVIKSNTLTSFSSFNERSTLRDSTGLTFSNFESGLEQECVFDEINSILSGDFSRSEEKYEYKINIKRPQNPFDKNFCFEECDD